MYKMKNIYSWNRDDDKKMPQQSGEGDVYQQLERRQELILQQLSDLHAQVSVIKCDLEMGQKQKAPVVPSAAVVKPSLDTKMQQKDHFQDIVVSADPRDPPLSLWVLTALMQASSSQGIHLCAHTHSSVVRCLPDNIQKLSSSGSDILSGPRSQQRLIVTLIWKNVGHEPELMVNPVLQTAIRGEANIARYLGRLLAKDLVSPEEATEVDCWLDLATLATSGNGKTRHNFLETMNSQLGRTQYLVGDSLSVADIVAWSALLKSSEESNLPSNVTRWWKMLYLQPAFHHMPMQFGVH